MSWRCKVLRFLLERSTFSKSLLVLKNGMTMEMRGRSDGHRSTLLFEKGPKIISGRGRCVKGQQPLKTTVTGIIIRSKGSTSQNVFLPPLTTIISFT